MIKPSRLLKYALISIVAIGVLNVTISSVSSVVQADKPVMQQDSDLLAKANELSLDVSQLNLKYSNAFDADKRARFEQTIVNEKLTYTIVVKLGMTANDTYKSFAHEYYHYVWTTNPTIYGRLSTSLQDFYKSYIPLHERMSVYIDFGLAPDSKDFADELFAVSCTDVDSAKMPTAILSECNKWANRSMITASY